MAVIILVAGVVMGITVLALAMARSIYSKNTSPLPHQPPADWVVHGFGCGLHGEHICHSCTGRFGASQTPTVPMQSLHVDVCCRSCGKVVELGSFLPFCPGNCTIWEEDHLWIVPIAVSLYVLLPYVFEAQFVQGVACFPDDNNTHYFQAHHAFFVSWATAGGLIPISVSIAVPIICFCYIKKNIVTEDAQYRKGMTKFSLFLVIGGAINIAGQLLPGAISYFVEAPGLYCAYGIAAVSLLPTTIIIIAYLKPVQEQFKKMFTCRKLTKKGEGSSLTTSTNIPNETEWRV